MSARTLMLREALEESAELGFPDVNVTQRVPADDRHVPSTDLYLNGVLTALHSSFATL